MEGRARGRARGRPQGHDGGGGGDGDRGGHNRGGGRGGRGGQRGGGVDRISEGVQNIGLGGEGGGRGGGDRGRGGGDRGRGGGGRGGRRKDDEPEFDCIRTKPEHMQSKKGASGTAVALSANFFGFQQKPDTRLFQYRVDFSLDEERTFMKKALLRQHKAILPQYMFDGSILLCFTR